MIFQMRVLDKNGNYVKTITSKELRKKYWDKYWEKELSNSSKRSKKRNKVKEPD